MVVCCKDPLTGLVFFLCLLPVQQGHVLLHFSEMYGNFLANASLVNEYSKWACPSLNWQTKTFGCIWVISLSMFSWPPFCTCIIVQNYHSLTSPLPAYLSASSFRSNPIRLYVHSLLLSPSLDGMEFEICTYNSVYWKRNCEGVKDDKELKWQMGK